MDSDKNTVEPTPSIEKVEYSGSDFNGLEAQVDTRKGKKMEVENDSVKLRLDNELIKASHIQSMDAHKNSQPYITSNKKEGAGSSSSSSSAAMEILIFAFNRLSEDDWYHDALFGETDIEKHLFPCLRRIGEDRLAKVNKIFLQRFQDILNNTGFKSEVEKAVMVDAKKVLFTGHSSGGAIASFATLWMLDEYTRKRGIKTPIGCLTFGSPLIGDDTLSHAVRREKWAGHFTHFVMEHDIVPRIMLAPKTSIQEHLPKILKIFQQNIKSTTRKPNITGIPFGKKTPDRTIDNDQLLKPDEAVSFFENILIHASKVASHDASVLMESTSSLMEKFSVDFVKLSPYRPFGHYVFCTCDNDQDPTETRQLLVVENPNAVLQLLFYFLQLPKDDQDLVEFSVNSFEESFSYGEELNKNGLQLQNMVYLKDLNKQLLGYDGTTDDVVHTSNKALFQLDLSARMCLMAVEEAEDRKKENEERIKTSMRKYQTQTAKNEQRIIEVILDEIRNYKEKKTNKNMDYYEAFKLQNNEDDFRANVNRLELAKIFDEIIEMVMTKDLPDEFEVKDEWVTLGTSFRRLVEPLDIANYYRHGGTGYMSARPKRYKFTQRWYEHAHAMGFEMISESNFMEEVEELKKDAEEPRNKTIEEIKARFESIKIQVPKWKSDDKIPNDDVYWGESALSMLEEKLS
ncbi:EDS1-like protein [Tanacetum coccineum]|uniref:EDS1-like protein n=1 Tax=Tanacetum coccineum TaxID=301880 RepID=A0ABQ5HEV4_9ASTR